MTFGQIATLALGAVLSLAPVLSHARATPARATVSADSLRLPSYTEAHRRITAQLGARFVLVLQSNPSTGFGWQLVDSTRQRPVRLVGHEFRGPERQGNPPIVGAPGHERWTFRATAPGTAVIRLVYVRPWEKTPPQDTTKFRVTVR